MPHENSSSPSPVRSSEHDVGGAPEAGPPFGQDSSKLVDADAASSSAAKPKSPLSRFRLQNLVQRLQRPLKVRLTFSRNFISSFVKFADMCFHYACFSLAQDVPPFWHHNSRLTMHTPWMDQRCC